MLRFGFGKRMKPRKFDYIPRFYDEQKDQLDSRIDKYHGDVTEGAKVKERIKSGLRSQYQGNAEYRSREVKRSNLRLLYIIVTLILVAFLILRTDKISNFINSM